MRYLWIACVSVSLWGRTVDLSNFQEGVTSLAGIWKFHPGDDARWADPKFDDSSWKPIQVPGGLAEQGYPSFSGYGWYRVALTADRPRDLALAVGRLIGAYEVYANGTSIGRFGSFPPDNRIYDQRLMSFEVLKARWDRDKLVIAIKYWKDPRFAWNNRAGILRGPIEIGAPRLIQNAIAASKYDYFSNDLSTAFVKSAQLYLALGLIAIFLLDRRPEYLWLGVMFASDAIWQMLMWVRVSTFLWSYPAGAVIQDCFASLVAFAEIIGICYLLGIRIGRGIKTYLIVYVLFSIYLHWSLQEGYYRSTLTVITVADNLLDNLIILFLIIYGCRTATTYSRWLAISFIPDTVIDIFQYLLFFVPQLTRFISSETVAALSANLMAITIVTFAYLLLRRFGSARAEEQRLHAEMETARQVQLLMQPAQSISVPHLRIDPAYYPVQEIGGDFFQISQDADDSLLMVVGDVSGKGLKAALTVSLIVGLWQDVSDDAGQSPGKILERLNKRLTSRIQDGFVTCLCLRLGRNGSLTVANAGHLAPYVNGQELALESGLPLGVSAESEYPETHGVLPPDYNLVMISDGVVEARDKTKSFFGFDRLQQALAENLSAEAIARKAQAFGQEDDITVVSIVREPAQFSPGSEQSPLLTCRSTQSA